MFFYFIFCLIVFTSVSIWGAFIVSVLKLKKSLQVRDYIPAVYFLGLAVLSVISGYFSIFFSINKTTTICFFILTFSLFILYRPKNLLSYSGEKINIRFISIAIFFLVILSLFAATGIYNTDSGEYHVQAIKWINSFPVIPGLGNLHGRFAFNSLFFTVSALFSLEYTIGGREVLMYPLNAVSFWVFATWQYYYVRSALINTDYKSAIVHCSFVAFLLIYLLKWVSSPTPDMICTILTLLVFHILFTKKEDTPLFKVLLPIILFIIIAYKLSGIALGLVILLYFVKKETWTKDVLTYGVLAIVILVPFFIRNYLLSGYLLYPFPAIDLFNPDWKIPMKNVIAEKSVIESWAKIPFHQQHYKEVVSMSFMEWFPTWLMSKDILLKMVIAVGLLFPLLALILSRVKKIGDPKIAILVLAGNLFWMGTAPDPRFHYGFLFFTFAYTIYLFVQLSEDYVKQPILRIFFFLHILFFTIPLFAIYPKYLSSYLENPSQLIFPRPFSNTFPAPEYTRVINNGIEYLLPESACYNLPIPCNPGGAVDPNLTLRGNNLANGFRIKIE